MDRRQLFEQIKKKESFLCVGLDSELAKLPPVLRESAQAQFAFNRSIVDATAPYAVCYKPNLAFYEQDGARGFSAFVNTCRYIRDNYPDMFIIADAKRGDIGNTSRMYAEAFFKDGLVDALTVSPYMGRDTVAPVLEHEGRWAVVLALTSNPSADDFQKQLMANGSPLYENVINTSKEWGTPDNMMYVVGATRADMLAGVREMVPEHFLLVPGVGAQGGSLEDVAKFGMNKMCGLLVNSSRNIIFADAGSEFADAAARAAAGVQAQMRGLLGKYL